jgi:DNA polymerase elongation subunit (family B)
MKILSGTVDIFQSELLDIIQHIDVDVTALTSTAYLNDAIDSEKPDFVFINDEIISAYEKSLEKKQTPIILYTSKNSEWPKLNIKYKCGTQIRNYANIFKYKRQAPRYIYESDILFVLSDLYYRPLVDHMLQTRHLRLKLVSDEFVQCAAYVGQCNADQLMSLAASTKLVLCQHENIKAVFSLRDIPVKLLPSLDTEELKELVDNVDQLDVVSEKQKYLPYTIFDKVHDLMMGIGQPILAAKTETEKAKYL